MVLNYNKFTLHRKVENHTNLRKKSSACSDKTIKKTKPEEKNAFSCGASALIMFSLYKADANFLPMEHVNSRSK